MIRLLIAEDQGMVRGALAALLTFEPDLEVVAQVSSGEEVLPAAREARPDVALLDIEMPGIDGIEAAARLHDELPDCKALILGQQQPDHRALANVSGECCWERSPSSGTRASSLNPPSGNAPASSVPPASAMRSARPRNPVPSST